VKLSISQPFVGTALSIVAAVAVTAQAMSAPRKPHKVRDLVPASERAQAQFADVCQMYPSECRLNPDGSIARVVGRRIMPGADAAVLNHFRTGISAVQMPSWDELARGDLASTQRASNNTND
jgi:predicted transglutaminase-like cysteine proteinase